MKEKIQIIKSMDLHLVLPVMFILIVSGVIRSVSDTQESGVLIMIGLPPIIMIVCKLFSNTSDAPTNTSMRPVYITSGLAMILSLPMLYFQGTTPCKRVWLSVINIAFSIALSVLYVHLDKAMDIGIQRQKKKADSVPLGRVPVEYEFNYLFERLQNKTDE